MSAFTMLIIAVMVALFAAFASTLAWAQQHARSPHPAPAEVLRRKRRSF